MDSRSADQVIVVKDQHTLPVAGHDRIDESREDLLQIQFRGGAQALADVRQLGCRAERLRQAGNKVGTEGDWGIITRIQCIPGDGDSILQKCVGPLSQ